VSAEAAHKAEDQYLVHFPNGEVEQVSITRLFVRWGRAIEDPTEYLAAKITDTPFFFEGRSRIVRHFAKQRAAFGGMTALASSGIELLEHQVSLVRKVLADPIQRYLLADEVGLGKTIEAGILIKQHLLDQPSESSILVVVPDHLTTQWRLELSGKFGISPLDSRLRVVAMSKWSDKDSDPARTMIVVDEAHLLANWAFSEDSEARRSFAFIWNSCSLPRTSVSLDVESPGSVGISAGRSERFQSSGQRTPDRGGGVGRSYGPCKWQFCQ